MVGRCRDDTGVRACACNRCCAALTVVGRGVGLGLGEVAIVVASRVASVATVGCIVLFSRLWADAAKASKPRAALARVVMIVVRVSD